MRLIVANWESLYGDVLEDIPVNRPEPRGIPVWVSLLCDADHAGNFLTRQSHTGLFIFINNSLIDWHSKGQDTVESSTFGSETIAMTTGIDKVQALRYKLYMTGVLMDVPADVFCENQLVVLTARKPDISLSKKQNAINYHRIREAAARKWIPVAFKSGAINLANLLTKILPIRKRKNILWKLTQYNGGRMPILWLNLRRGRKPMKAETLLITSMRIDPVKMNGSPHVLWGML